MLDALSEREYAVVRDYLLRRATLAPEARAALARELGDTVAARLGLEAAPGGDGAEALLERVAAAYRARHESRPPAWREAPS